MGHDVRIKVVFDYECPLLEPRILTNPHMIQTGHIWFFQLAVCFWVLGLPLFTKNLQTTMPIVVLKGLWRTGLVSTTWLIRRWLRQDYEKDDGMYVKKRVCFKSNAKTIQIYCKNPGPNAKICVAMCFAICWKIC